MSERTTGETEGPEQEPTEAGEQDPAVRDPRPDGPMRQGGAAGNEQFGKSPDAAYGRREGQAEDAEEGSPT
jgi:hypothetical protein